MCISFLSQILLNLELDTPKRLDVFLGHPFWMLKFCLILANDFSADLSRCANNLLEFDKCAHPKPQCVGVARIEIFLFTHRIRGCANLQFVRTPPQCNTSQSSQQLIKTSAPVLKMVCQDGKVTLRQSRH